VNVFAEASRFDPPLAVPPSSSTWKVKLGIRTGVGVERRSEVEVGYAGKGNESPAITGVPLSVREPAVGSVVISTRLRALAGCHWGR